MQKMHLKAEKRSIITQADKEYTSSNCNANVEVWIRHVLYVNTYTRPIGIT